MKFKNFLINIAKPICNGTAGVNGPVQNTSTNVTTHHRLATPMTDSSAGTQRGLQNMASAIMKLRIMSLFKTVFLSHNHSFFALSFNVGFGAFLIYLTTINRLIIN